jgi:hypothetical protein
MADNEVQIVISATDNASKVITALSETFKIVSEDIAKLVEQYTAYGDQVKDLSLFTGVATDETSRLIQVGREADVTYDTLKMSAKKMATDGLQPSTDNLAKLSDQFKAIHDPVQRSQFLIDNFGRSGMEMAKIMDLGGDSIRKMSAGVSDSLILDEKKIAAIEKSKLEMVQFNQEMDAVKYEAAGKLLDIFNEMPKPMRDVIQLMGAAGQSGMLQQFTQLSILFTEISRAGGIGAIFTGIGTGARAMAAGLAEVAAPIAITVAWLDFMIHLVQDNWGTISKLFAIIGYYTLGIDPTWAVGNEDSGALSISGMQAKIDALPHRARGGDASGWTVAGEGGPELIRLPAGSHVYSNQQSAAMMGGQTVNNFYYQPFLSTASEDDLRRAAPIFKRMQRYAA